MADWGVVGVCAAGGLVAGPLLDRLARTVRRPVKKTPLHAAVPSGAEGAIGGPTAATDAEPLPAPLIQAEPSLMAARVSAEGGTAPGTTSAAAAETPAPLTWTSVGWGGWLQNVAAAVTTAALEGLLALRLGAVPALGAYGALMAALVCLSIVDFRTGLLPRRFVYAGYVLVGVGLVAASNVSTTWHELLRALIGGVAAFVIFYVIWFFYRKGMGFGDVRLSGLLGMALGWLGWRQEYIGFLAACVLGSVLGIAFLVAVRRSRPFPFGPALAAGTAFGVLWGGWLGDLWFHAR